MTHCRFFCRPQYKMGGSVSTLLSIDRYVRLGLRWAIISLMVSMTILVFLQVVFRYVWDNPLAWSEEIARFFFVWITFLSAANLLRIGQHISVKTFVEMLPPVPRICAEAIGHLVVLACSIMFLFGGIGITIDEWMQRSPSLQIEMGWIYLVIPIASFLMVVWTIVDLTSMLFEMKARKEL